MFVRIRHKHLRVLTRPYIPELYVMPRSPRSVSGLCPPLADRALDPTLCLTNPDNVSSDSSKVTSCESHCLPQRHINRSPAPRKEIPSHANMSIRWNPNTTTEPQAIKQMLSTTGTHNRTVRHPLHNRESEVTNVLKGYWNERPYRSLQRTSGCVVETAHHPPPRPG